MKQFSPLIFLASLGAGGIAVAPFAFLQYVHPHGKGLITISDILTQSIWHPFIYIILSMVMIVFTALHIYLTARFVKLWMQYRNTHAYTDVLHNPLVHASLITPYLSLAMTLNVFIGPVRFFVPILSHNLQALMMPALFVWLVLGAFLFIKVTTLLKTAFTKSFNMRDANFGWLLVSFALAMWAVTGTGFAALAQNATIAHTSAFLSMSAGMFGLFLLFIKIVTLFQNYFSSADLPDKKMLPSVLIVIPIVTVYAIGLFRLGHYMEHFFGAHLNAYFTVVTTGALAFETAYFFFAGALMSAVVKSISQKEYFVTMWGLICPFVAFGVLLSFVYSTFVQTWIISSISLGMLFIAIVLYVIVGIRALHCARSDHGATICI